MIPDGPLNLDFRFLGLLKQLRQVYFKFKTIFQRSVTSPTAIFEYWLCLKSYVFQIVFFRRVAFVYK